VANNYVDDASLQSVPDFSESLFKFVIDASGVGTGVQAVQWTGAPELLGPRVVVPQKNFRQDS